MKILGAPRSLQVAGGFFKEGLFLLFFSLAACVYHVGIHSDSDRFHQPIAIPVFENQTFEPILGKRINESFKETFLARGWKVTGDLNRASIILAGRVIQFEQIPISLNLQGQAEEYRLKVVLRYTVRENGKTASLPERDAEATTEYIAQSDAVKDRVAKDRAIREAGRQLAERVADFLLERHAPPPLETGPSKE